MKKAVIVDITSFLFILLFVYAALSKLMDVEKFSVQLGQSPLLTAFANWIVWIVPFSEIIIALMLMTERFKLIGFYAAFSLMAMFTTYIVIILNFTSYIPCSCGGILEKLGWTEHLIFNVIFTLLALTGIIFLTQGRSFNKTAVA